MQVGLAQRVQQLRFAARARVALDRALEAHRRRLGVIALEIEARHVDLVIDEPLQHLACGSRPPSSCTASRELLAEVRRARAARRSPPTDPSRTTAAAARRPRACPCSSSRRSGTRRSRPRPSRASGAGARSSCSCRSPRCSCRARTVCRRCPAQPAPRTSRTGTSASRTGSTSAPRDSFRPSARPDLSRNSAWP